jgi:Ca2+-binding EF-hand superfamily protein
MGPQTRTQVQAKIKEHFAKVDANKDGAITKAEADAARAAMKAEWQKKRGERRAEMFGKLDTDKNGQLSQAEFNAPRSDRAKNDGERGGKWRGHRGGHHGGMGMGRMGGGMFERLDANKDGKVTLAEASAKRLEMFDKADANKDGTVTPEEREAAWGAMRANGARSRADAPGAIPLPSAGEGRDEGPRLFRSVAYRREGWRALIPPSPSMTAPPHPYNRALLAGRLFGGCTGSDGCTCRRAGT